KRGRNNVVEQVAVEISVTGDVAGGVCLYGSRQDENAGPNPLDDETPRWDVILVQLSHAPEEETVARHGVVGARAGENEPVIAAERRNHDRNGHDGRASARKDYVGRLRRDPVARRILNRSERKRRHVSNVGEQIKSDNQKGAERERERNIAPWIFHFSGGEGDVVPGIGGEKGIGLGHANGDEEAECGRRGQTFADILQTAAQGPKIAEVRRTRTRLQTDDDAKQNKG